jgi:hypothetical protein
VNLRNVVLGLLVTLGVAALLVWAILEPIIR